MDTVEQQAPLFSGQSFYSPTPTYLNVFTSEKRAASNNREILPSRDVRYSKAYLFKIKFLFIKSNLCYIEPLLQYTFYSKYNFKQLFFNFKIHFFSFSFLFYNYCVYIETISLLFSEICILKKRTKNIPKSSCKTAFLYNSGKKSFILLRRNMTVTLKQNSYDRNDTYIYLSHDTI